MTDTGGTMRIYSLKPLSICDTNSYLVASEQNNAVLIDAPADADYILEQIGVYGLTLKKIFLTHGHFDHIGAVADLVEKTGCEVYICAFDKDKIYDEHGMLATHFMQRGFKKYTGEVITFTENDVLTLDELEFDVLETPGHTKGSVCFICKDVMFSGDTLFARSCGRTDLPDGDPAAMKRSMKKIRDLGGDLKVYPGHMHSTTLDTERKYNHYLQDL